MSRNTITPLLFFFFLSLAFVVTGAEDFHRVPAKSGDNIPRLLKRYQLHGSSCNLEKFHELNDLKRDAKLIAGRKYFIPVLIYQYNGRSIRSTLGITGWEQALRIKKYNEYVKQQQLRRYSLVQSNILWVPYHELFCNGKTPPKINAEPVPPKKDDQLLAAEANNRNKKLSKVDNKVLAKAKEVNGFRKFAIFGRKHAFVPLIDNKLRGKVFYLVSGHGGPDVGAVGKQGNHQLCEDEYAYDVSLRLARKLIEHGALVYMITRDPDDGIRDGKYLGCDYDEYCWGDYKIPRNQKSRLYQRSDAVNSLYDKHKNQQGIRSEDQITVVIHIDSRHQGENTDVYFYYYPGSRQGRSVAKNLHKTFAQKYKQYRKTGQYFGTVTSRDLHMLREPKTTSVFIELGNIRNRYDQQRLVLESNREALAKWLYEGLARNYK